MDGILIADWRVRFRFSVVSVKGLSTISNASATARVINNHCKDQTFETNTTRGVVPEFYIYFRAISCMKADVIIIVAASSPNAKYTLRENSSAFRSFSLRIKH